MPGRHTARFAGLVVCVMVAAATGPSSQDRAQAPTFRASTTLVEVDAIVKDGGGRFAADLGAADFEVLENGVAQRIETFYLVEGPRPSSAGRGALAATSPSAAPPAESTSWPPKPSSQRAFVFDFDLEHLAAATLGRAKTAAAAFLASDFLPGDVGGVVAGGTLLNSRLTTDPVELRAAVNGVRSPGEARSRELDLRAWPRFASLWEVQQVNARDERVIGIVVDRACLEQPDQCNPDRDPVRIQVESKGQSLAAQSRASGMRSLATLQGLSEALAKFPGRKTILFLSEGFLSEELAGQVRDVVAQAAASNVRIYSVDARGLNRGSADSRILDAPGPVTAPGNFEFDVATDGPNSLAVDTGGIAIRNENNYSRAFREIAEDTSSYYVLGFRPSAPGDGKFRTLTVRVKRAGLRVRARKGYVSATATAASNAAAGPEPAPAAEASAPDAPAPLPAVPVTHGEILLGSGAAGADGTPTALDPGSVRLRPFAATGAADAARLREERSEALPPDLAAAAQRGWEAYQRGDTRAARGGLAAPASHPAAPPWMHYVLGWASFAEGDTRAARAEWERVIAQVPEFAPVYLDLADTYLREGRRPDALMVLGEAEHRWPANVDVLNALGVVRAAIGRLSDAILAFERAVAAAPADGISHYNLARVSEIRFVAAASGKTPGTLPQTADRERAVHAYHRVVELGGPELEEVQRSLFRLELLDASQVTFSKPTVVRLKDSQLGGTPVRLAWSPDGTSFCLRATERDRRGRLLRSALRLVTMDGRVQEISEAPEWTAAYWNWKSALQAPWLPDVKVTTEQRMDGRGIDQLTATRPDLSRAAHMTSEPVYRFQGEVIGIRSEEDFVAGTTFGWAPFAMGAIAATDARGVLRIIDAAGRRSEVPDSRVALLPAWSPDGRRLAFIRQDRGVAIVIVAVAQSPHGTP